MWGNTRGSARNIQTSYLHMLVLISFYGPERQGGIDNQTAEEGM